MGQKSVRKNKNMYQLARENAGLSREQASEKLEFISPRQLVSFEDGTQLPHPEDVLAMAQCYGAAELPNEFCACNCAIGIKKGARHIELKELSQLVLTVLSSLHGAEKKTERLIDIAEDGVIDEREIEDFVDIQDQLEKVSIVYDALRLWSEQMLDSGKINREKYEEILKRRSDNQNSM